MCATPARHRAQHRDDAGAAWQFWSASGLVDRDGQRGSAKHARHSPSRYAAQIGRVGALAVSLGIGLAVANSSGVAYADTNSESGGDTGSVSSDPGPSSSGSSEPSDDTSADADDADEADPDGANEADPVDVDDPDADEDNDSVEPDAIEEELEPPIPDLEEDDETPSPPPDVPADEPADRPSGGDDTPSAPAPTDDASTIRESDELAEPVDESTVGGEEREEAAPQTELVSLDGVTTARTVAPVSDVQESVETISMVSALVSNVVSPFADPEAPAQAPWFDALLAWVRRQISHTFFNKTPVLTKAVETEQILASYWITLDAVDPNGDVLKYEIVQPSTGVVIRELISGKFIYTPFLPPVGDPRTDTIQIIVRDSTEHLTGALGTVQEVLHSIARALGLAQPDDLVVNIDVVVNPLVKLPPLVTPISGPGFTLGGDPAKVVSAVDIVDGDSDYLSKAVLEVTAFAQDGDTLGYVAPVDNPIDGVVSADGKTLTLIGQGTKAQYEEALKAVTFSATTGALLVRTVTISVTDADGVANIAPGFVLVGVKFSDAPTVLTVGTPTFTLGGGAVKVLSSATIGDTDSSHLSGATVKLTTLAQGGDTLGFAPIGGVPITATWDAGNKTLTLSGVATKAQYEQALEAVTFTATGGALLVRGVSISVTDDTGVGSIIPGAALINVKFSDAPTVLTVGTPTYTLGTSAVKVLSSATIGDTDSSHLSGATVKLTTLAQNGDTLGFAPIGGVPITATWDAGNKTLTLSGVATKAQYEQALEAVTFTATGGALLVRGVSISVTDDSGVGSIIPGAALINVRENSAPILLIAGVSSYDLNDPPIRPLQSVTITDDLDTLSGATVKITLFVRDNDVLGYVQPAGNPVTVSSWDPGSHTLKLSGTGTAAQYEQALKAVTFRTNQGAVTTRSITIYVTDNAGKDSLTGLVTVSVWL